MQRGLVECPYPYAALGWVKGTIPPAAPRYCYPNAQFMISPLDFGRTTQNCSLASSTYRRRQIPYPYLSQRRTLRFRRTDYDSSQRSTSFLLWQIAGLPAGDYWCPLRITFLPSTGRNAKEPYNKCPAGRRAPIDRQHTVSTIRPCRKQWFLARTLQRYQ